MVERSDGEERVYRFLDILIFNICEMEGFRVGRGFLSENLRKLGFVFSIFLIGNNFNVFLFGFRLINCGRVILWKVI